MAAHDTGDGHPTPNRSGMLLDFGCALGAQDPRQQSPARCQYHEEIRSP